MDIRLAADGTVHLARRNRPGAITLVPEDGPAREYQVIVTPGGGFAVRTESSFHPADAVRHGDTIWVRFEGRTHRFEIIHGTGRSRTRAGGDLASPMPGQVQNILVGEGDRVESHQPILVVEAMKMQLEIKAPHAGKVKRILVGTGDQVEAGIPLAELEAEP